MRISDWSSDVCSSDLNHNQPCRYHNRGIAQLDNPHIESIPRSPLMPVCLLAAAAMPAFPASGILRQSDPTRHAGRFPQRSARTESAARFVQLERIWLMAIKPSLPLIQSSDAESPNQAAGELLLSTPLDSCAC